MERGLDFRLSAGWEGQPGILLLAEGGLGGRDMDRLPKQVEALGPQAMSKIKALFLREMIEAPAF